MSGVRHSATGSIAAPVASLAACFPDLCQRLVPENASDSAAAPATPVSTVGIQE